jgi:hypothetical protein
MSILDRTATARDDFEDDKEPVWDAVTGAYLVQICNDADNALVHWNTERPTWHKIAVMMSRYFIPYHYEYFNIWAEISRNLMMYGRRERQGPLKWDEVLRG